MSEQERTARLLCGSNACHIGEEVRHRHRRPLQADERPCAYAQEQAHMLIKADLALIAHKPTEADVGRVAAAVLLADDKDIDGPDEADELLKTWTASSNEECREYAENYREIARAAWRAIVGGEHGD